MNCGVSSRSLRAITVAALAALLTACAAGPGIIRDIPEGDYRERIQVQERAGVRVSAAVPSAAESRQLFGKDLYGRGIQPVWLEIDNERDETLTFLPVGLDPQYFPPLEVANLDASESAAPESLVNRFFVDQGMNLLVAPGETVSGFVFSKLDEGTKSFNVDINSVDRFDTFTFFIPVPGLDVDHYSVDWAGLYGDEEWLALDEEPLLEAIESFACCVVDKKGKNTGDPLNLVVIGKPLDVYTAFIRAGWDETETVTRASAWKTFKSFVSGGEYRYSPVSSLYVFDRPQDVAFQWTRDNIHERNHLRLWMSRVTWRGLPVWIGQISRDIGVRFTTKTITTHKIDPNVDETREYLLENLGYAQSLKAFGYVGGVGAVSRDQPRGNLTGDPWFTDGYRLVLWVTAEPTAVDDITYLDWRNPHEQR